MLRARYAIALSVASLLPVLAAACGSSRSASSPGSPASDASTQVPLDGACDPAQDDCLRGHDICRIYFCDPVLHVCSVRANEVSMCAPPEEDASRACANDCEGGTACMDGQCRVPCASNDECGTGAACNAGAICLPPPDCVAADGAADCATVCYGWCTGDDAGGPDAGG